jgi:TQXA domain-containing protein
MNIGKSVADSIIRRVLSLSVAIMMILGSSVPNFSAVYAGDTGSTQGSVDYSARWVDSGSSVELTVKPAKAGTVYYLMQNSGAPAPSESSVESNTACSANQETTIKISSGDRTAKDIYVIYKENGSDSSYEMSKLMLPEYKTMSVSEGSSAGSVSISGERNEPDQLSLTVKPTMNGTLYYLVKDADAPAPSRIELLTAQGIKERAYTATTTKISLGTDTDKAKKLYLLYKANDNNVGVVGNVAVMDVPAFERQNYAAEVDKDQLDLGTVLEGYKPSDNEAAATIRNTGENGLSFSVKTTEAFDKYFEVKDTSITKNIAPGETGFVAVKPKEGLSEGEYSGEFYLEDKIDENNTLKLGPVKVKMTVTRKGDGTVDGVRTPEGKFTPSVSNSLLNIDNKVAYCANYYYILDSTSNSKMHNLYDNQFSVIRNVTNKELDSYTGLDPNKKPAVYPPNKKGFTPVKVGRDSSTVRDDVARVLYYGYPNDAAGLISNGNTSSGFYGNDQNYIYNLDMKSKKDLAYAIATQCAIWHYTDGIDFHDIGEASSSDRRVSHVRQIYRMSDWGWKDIQNIYNYLVGNSDTLVYELYKSRGVFRNGVAYPSHLKDAPDNFAVDLFVVNNPVNTNGIDYWTQNLVTGTPDNEPTDVSITKRWDDKSNANSKRPDAETFKKWIRLYNGTTDVTDKYADKLTVKDNGDDTYTVTYTGLPQSEYSYTVKEVIPDDSDYKIPDDQNSAIKGGSITNHYPVKKSQESELTIKKTDNDGKALDGAKFTLYSDKKCTHAITDKDAVVAANGKVTISTGASYLQDYLPTENNGTATVYLKETTAPTGYKASDTVYPITLGTVIEKGWNSSSTEYDITTSHTITYGCSKVLTVKNAPVTKCDEKYEKLKITKVSDDGKTNLKGAVFTLYKDQSCTNKITDLEPTAADGTVVIDTKSLPSGLTNPKTGTSTYYLKETKAPENYTAAGTVYKIVLGTSSSSDWNSDNTAYVTTKTHTISCSGSNELRVSNTKKDATVKNSELTIVKSDADTSAVLEGAKFALYKDEACTNIVDGSEITTDSTGHAFINTSADYLKNDLPTEDGTKTFYLKETSAPAGYLKSDEAHQISITRSTKDNVVTYSITSGPSSTLEVANKPDKDEKTVNAELTLHKVSNTQKPLSGAEFTLYSDPDCKTAVKALTTGENGKVTVSTGDLKNYLPDSGEKKIYLKETKAPSGYAVNDKVYTLTLGRKVSENWNADHTKKVTTTAYSITCDGSADVTVVDQPVVDLKVIKHWEIGLNSTPVTFKLTQNGKETDRTLLLTENDNWSGVFRDLPKYDKDGSEIKYGVIEVDGDKNYDVSYDENSDGSITVTNSAKKIHNKEIHTTVTANGTSSSAEKAAETSDTRVKVVDTVTYKNLTAGTEYTLKGQLMDVTDIDNIVPVGEARTRTFTAAQADGSEQIDLGTLDLTPGHTYVVFEELYNGNTTEGTPVAGHKDKNDKAQTFVVKEETPTPVPETPSIRTTVSANGTASTSEKAVETSDTSVDVVDTVSYDNLTAGTEYTLKGQLMDVTDADNIVPVGEAGTKTFTPASSSGTQDVSLGTLELTPGHTYVVFETLYKGSKAEGTPEAEHSDKNDKAQTIVVTEETPHKPGTPPDKTTISGNGKEIVSVNGAPSIRTTISADGRKSTSKEAVKTHKSSVNVTDTVFYRRLKAGKTYSIRGRLIDVTSGGSVVDTATITFTARKANGTVKVDFGRVSLKPGHKYVAFEYLYKGKKASGTPVAVHKDKNDKAQTMIATGTGNAGSVGSSSTGLIKTGDDPALYYWALLLAGALAGAFITIRKRRTSKR